jgi:hypothetical protein
MNSLSKLHRKPLAAGADSSSSLSSTGSDSTSASQVTGKLTLRGILARFPGARTKFSLEREQQVRRSYGIPEHEPVLALLCCFTATPGWRRGIVACASGLRWRGAFIRAEGVILWEELVALEQESIHRDGQILFLTCPIECSSIGKQHVVGFQQLRKSLITWLDTNDAEQHHRQVQEPLQDSSTEITLAHLLKLPVISEEELQKATVGQMKNAAGYWRFLMHIGDRGSTLASVVAQVSGSIPLIGAALEAGAWVVQTLSRLQDNNQSMMGLLDLVNNYTPVLKSIQWLVVLALSVVAPTSSVILFLILCWRSAHSL